MKKTIFAVMCCCAIAVMGCKSTVKEEETTVTTEAPAMMAMPAAAMESDALPPASHGDSVVHNTEEYDRIVENDFKDAKNNPLSTFSIDVDNASYSNVRRIIESGNLPEKGAVRIEEFINTLNTVIRSLRAMTLSLLPQRFGMRHGPKGTSW